MRSAAAGSTPARCNQRALLGGVAPARRGRKSRTCHSTRSPSATMMPTRTSPHSPTRTRRSPHGLGAGQHAHSDSLWRNKTRVAPTNRRPGGASNLHVGRTPTRYTQGRNTPMHERKSAAGRKPIPAQCKRVQVTITIAPETAAWLRQQANAYTSIGHVIDLLVVRAMSRDDPTEYDA